MIIDTIRNLMKGAHSINWDGKTLELSTITKKHNFTFEPSFFGGYTSEVLGIKVSSTYTVGANNRKLFDTMELTDPNDIENNLLLIAEIKREFIRLTEEARQRELNALYSEWRQLKAKGRETEDKGESSGKD